MKKIVTFLCLLALCLSLCACGQSAQPVQEEPSPAQLEPAQLEPSKGDLMYEKYGSIIDNLESEDYQAAIDEIRAMLPEPEIIEVSITPENFYDYYELVDIEPYISKDANGKVLEVWPYLDMQFILKSEYQDRLINEGSKVEIGVTADYSLRTISVDWNTGEWSFGEEDLPDIMAAIIADYAPYDTSIEEGLSATVEGVDSFMLQAGGLASICYTKGEYGWTQGVFDQYYNGQDMYAAKMVNIQIVRAEGTLLFNA